MKINILAEKPIILIVIVLLFHAVVNYFWLGIGSISRSCDVVNHLSNQKKFEVSLKENSLDRHDTGFRDLLWNPDNRYHNWPRTVYLISWMITYPFPKQHFFFSWITGIYFMGFSVAGTYMLGKRLYSNEIGLIGSILIAFTPAVFGLSRKYGLDLPLLAILPFSLCSIISFQENPNLRSSLSAGFLTGLALLIKPQAAIFICVPLIAAFSTIFKGSIKKEKQTDQMIIFAYCLCLIVISILVSSLWWYGHWNEIKHSIFNHLKKADFLAPSSVISDNLYLKLFFYPISMPIHFSPLFFVIFLAGIIFFEKKEWKIFFAFVLPPIIIFTFGFSNKWARYLFPIYPFLIIIMISSMKKAIKAHIHKLSLGILIAVSILCFLLSSFNIPIFSKAYFTLINYTDFLDGHYAHPSLRSNYLPVFDRLSKTIKTDFKSSEKMNIGVIESDIFWDNDGLPLVDYLIRYRIHQMDLYGDIRDPLIFQENHRNFDYFIIIEKQRGIGRKLSTIGTFGDANHWIGFANPGNIEKRLIPNVTQFINSTDVIFEDVLLPDNVKIFLTKNILRDY